MAQRQTDHARFLKLPGFPVAVTAQLTDTQRQLLARYGHWLEALANGTLEPLTPEQRSFVAVAHGEALPQTDFEIAWVEHRRALTATPPVIEVEIAQRLARIEAARLVAAATAEEYEARRAAIMQVVQAQLDALDAEFSERREVERLESEQAEAEARTAVLAYGSSFKYGRVQAIYARGRVTWDTRGLARYMESHPELGQFRRVGQPSVTFRLKPPSPPDAPQP